MEETMHVHRYRPKDRGTVLELHEAGLRELRPLDCVFYRKSLV